MNQVPVLNFQDFIAAEGEQLTTTSQQVAAVFGKRHAHVLDKIRALAQQLPAEFNEPNFRAVAFIDGKGESRVAYQITRDGFTLLAMSFTGKKALSFKLAYIAAFNAMAAFIRNQRDGLRYRCMEKELECKDSARRGSYHGKGLNLRKQEKPILESELAALQAMAQPTLLN
ncbi:MAG: Rha family transcriptional regulator [Pseudomonadota bacterium]